MLRNAATWSPKNIAAVRLMATSKAPGSKGWICASACANVTLVTPSSAARRRA